MEPKAKIMDITGTELTPGKPNECLGGDNHPEHPLCCDECDCYLACFPEWDSGGAAWQEQPFPKA